MTTTKNTTSRVQKNKREETAISHQDAKMDRGWWFAGGASERA
jgi:hypothetical protein